MAESSSSSHRESFSPIVLLAFVIIGTESFVGILVNSFIVAINAVLWVQKKAVSTSGKILLFLSASRIALQGVMVLHVIVVYTFPHFHLNCVFEYMYRVCFMFLNCCGLWFSAVLSFFYFVKIANFSCLPVLKLKRRISGLVPWLLWLSILISFGCSMSLFKCIFPMRCNSSSAFRHGNHTKTDKDKLAVFFSLGVFSPMVIFILTATLLIVSLKRHTLVMKNSATGSRDPSLEAHVGAIKAISYFLILYIFNAIAVFLLMSPIFLHRLVWNILLKIVVSAYPAGHSILLIQDNPGLKRAWKQLQSQIHLCRKEKIVR